MADETTQDTSTGTQTEIADPSTTARELPPEWKAELAAQVKAVRDAAFAEARRVFEGKSKQSTKTTQTEAPAQPTQLDAMAILKLRDELDDATADLKLTAGQRKLLRDEVMRSNPSDVAAHVQQYVTLAGWSQTSTTNTSTATTPQQAAPRSPTTVSNGGAPAAPRESLDEKNVFQMSKADQDALQRQLGPAKWVERIWRDAQRTRVQR